MTGKVTDSRHVTSPRKVAVFSVAQACRGVVTYPSAIFFKAGAVISGGTLRALPSMIPIILKKYIITSLAGQKALISAALDDDAFPLEYVSDCLTFRHQSGQIHRHHQRKSARS